MEAIILAGGFGRRLQTSVSDVPKPMADINGRPFLSYVLDYLANQHIKKVILSTGYKHESIEKYFGPQYNNLEITYVVEQVPLGTGGALKMALAYASEKNIAVLNGDTFFQVNLRNMYDFHIEKNALLTIALKPMRAFNRYGSVILNAGRIAAFEEKGFCESGYINGGLYFVKSDLSLLLEEEGESFSFETAFMERRTPGLNAFGFICDAYFVDIGTPEDYERAKTDLVNAVSRGTG